MLENFRKNKYTLFNSESSVKYVWLLTNKYTWVKAHFRLYCKDSEKPQIINDRGLLYLLDGLVDSSKCWLFVIVVNSPVTMENENTFLFSLLTVAAIDAVVWTVVPLAGEHI